METEPQTYLAAALPTTLMIYFLWYVHATALLPFALHQYGPGGYNPMKLKTIDFKSDGQK
jgi:hypothetical protein